jgi:hypothetical protein
MCGIKAVDSLITVPSSLLDHQWQHIYTQSRKRIAVLIFFLEIQAYVYQYKCRCINALRQIEPCIQRLID